MLYVKAFINDSPIETLCIGNTGKTRKRAGKVEYLYHVWTINKEAVVPKVSDVVQVWHRREDGWKKLTGKVIRALK